MSRLGWAPGWLLEGRANHWKEQAIIGNLEFSALPPNSLEKGKGLKMELMINHANMMKLPIVWGSESFWVGEQHIEVLEEWSARQGMDSRPLTLHVLSHKPCPIHLFYLHVHLYALLYSFIINLEMFS